MNAPRESAASKSATARRWAIAVTLLAAAVLTDYLTGEEVTSSLYYVVVVSYTTWFLGRRAGLAMAALSGLAWLGVYFLVGHPFSKTIVLVWNLAAESAIYTTFALVLGTVGDAFRRARALAERLRVTNQALDREIQAVGRLQRELLPAEMPRIPGYEWSVHYETSTRAGGDYYDFVTLPEGRVGILIADASGHGAPAAVLMAMARSLFHEVAAQNCGPERVMSEMERRLAALMPTGWFVTACYIVLEPASGAFEYSLAGHDPPWVLRAGAGAVERLPVSGGPLLGPFTEIGYGASRSRLDPGDVLVLSTDGLSEAQDREGHLLGDDAVRATLASSGALEADAVRDRVLERVAQHRGGAVASDDMTLLILGRAA
jgi:serine phosphatase RsbU (regulator of sigma subunit)